MSQKALRWPEAVRLIRSSRALSKPLDRRSKERKAMNEEDKQEMFWLSTRKPGSAVFPLSIRQAACAVCPQGRSRAEAHRNHLLGHRSKLMSRRTERPYKVDGAGELAPHSAARCSTPEINGPAVQ